MNLRPLLLLALAASACASPRAVEVAISQRNPGLSGPVAEYSFSVHEGCKLSLRELNHPARSGKGEPQECSALLKEASRREVLDGIRSAAACQQSASTLEAGLSVVLSSGELVSGNSLCVARGPAAELLKRTHQLYERSAPALREGDPVGSECEPTECRSDADVRTGIESPTCPDGSPAPHSERCVRVSPTACVWEGCQPLEK